MLNPSTSMASLPCLHLHNVLRTDVSSSVITQAGNHGRPPQGPLWWALPVDSFCNQFDFNVLGLLGVYLAGMILQKESTWSLNHSWALLKKILLHKHIQHYDNDYRMSCSHLPKKHKQAEPCLILNGKGVVHCIWSSLLQIVLYARSI